MFVVSTHDQVKSGVAVIPDGFQGHTTVNFSAFAKNKPVNLKLVITFFGDIYRADKIEFPSIQFVGTDTTVTWFYPPSSEGKDERDSDLQKLTAQYCVTLAQLNQPFGKSLLG